MVDNLWDRLGGAGPVSDAARRLEPVLSHLPDAEKSTSDDGFDVYTVSEKLTSVPGLGLASIGGQGSTISFRDATVTAALGIRGSDWRVDLSSPIVAIKVPGLRGAKLEADVLRLDPQHPDVEFVVPRLRVRFQQIGGVFSVTLLAAASSGTGQDDIYDGISMEPPHALIGPGEVVGFACRTAVLDLSGTSGPTHVPASARTMPDEWQGLFLPELRVFVSPSGLTGIAVNAGVRDLWIGLGDHEGVTGLFEAEVVNRSGAPTIFVGFRDDAGHSTGDPGDATAQVPEHVTMIVDTQGGLAPVAIGISVEGAVARTGDRIDLTVPETGSLSITVKADGAPPSTSSTRTITVARSSSPGAPPLPGETLAIDGDSSDRIQAVSRTSATVTVELASKAEANWTAADGTQLAPRGTTAEIAVALGSTVRVTATPTTATGFEAGCYFLFDHPFPGEVDDYRHGVPEMRTQPAPGPAAPSTASETFAAMIDRRRAEIAGRQVTVDGYASFEAPGSDVKKARNLQLSAARRDVVVGYLTDHGIAAKAGSADGSLDASLQQPVAPLMPAGPAPADGSGWWLAHLHTDDTANPPASVATISRQTAPAVSAVDPVPKPSKRPDCFRRIGLRVELVRGVFVRAEVYGEFDIETAAEQSLGTEKRPEKPANPYDGVCLFLVRLRITEDRGAWEVTGEFRAHEKDADGLAVLDHTKVKDPAALDTIGALALFAPLMATTASASAPGGAVVTLASAGLGALGVVQTQKITLYGAQMRVSHGIVGSDGITTGSRDGTRILVFLDIEIAFTFDFTVIRIDPAKPVTSRYKAIGMGITEGTGAGTPDFLPLPVFDSSQGYALDVPAGSLTAVPPLDNLLRILGFRVSRDNPTFLEVEAAFGIDLGIVTVDTVRVRVQLDGNGTPTISKLQATVDIPGTLHGTGMLELDITPTGTQIGGAFDLTIVPTNIRISADLLIASNNEGDIGVLIGGRVEFPVPILLGTSGLGIYGFFGGVAVNVDRDEAPYAGSDVPSLGWLAQQYTTTTGVMDPDGWALDAGSHSLVAGVLLGTVDGGFSVHVDGLLMLELPGPRLLFVVKADVLGLMPDFGEHKPATFLAVLDVDFGTGVIQIGVLAQYSIEHLLEIRVPVSAEFDVNHPADWHIYLGQYTDRVTVKILDAIEGSGYLMLQGSGLAIAPFPTQSGFAIATGFHLQAVLLGSKKSKLYLEVSAGFDALLALDPVYLSAKLNLSGELRLWIVSVSASASLEVAVGTVVTEQGDKGVTYIHGEVCGSVDFFFFEVKGCLGLTIGETVDPGHIPPALVPGVSFVSRTRSTVEGMATTEGVDAKVADAVALDGSGIPENPVPAVPIDAIPVVSFAAVPQITSDSVLGTTPHGAPGGGPSPWTRIGQTWWRYELVSIVLDGPLSHPLSDAVPSTWCLVEQNAPATLALLNWNPEPHPAAVPYGEQLITAVDRQWGTICEAPAPAADVLWTFADSPVGPSATGWVLDGTAWPDPVGLTRSAPVATRVRVVELWRLDPAVDRMLGTVPATVVGDAVPCYDGASYDAADAFRTWEKGQPLTFSSQAGEEATAEQIASALSSGGLRTLATRWRDTAWDPQSTRPRAPRVDCHGGVLRSPRFDRGEDARFGEEPEAQFVKSMRQGASLRSPDLMNAVAFGPDGDRFRRFDVLLLVSEQMLYDGSLVVRAEAADGTVLAEHVLAPTDTVAFPQEWVDPAGPWADAVTRAGRIAARIRHSESTGALPAYVRLDDLSDATSVVVIGSRRVGPDDRQPDRFHVVAFGGAFASERARADWDTTSKAKLAGALSNALTMPSDDVPLLVPGERYTLTATWKAAWSDAEDRPADTDQGRPEKIEDRKSVRQSFAFSASTDEPTDLDRWVQASTPAPDETGVFTAEPIVVEFTTSTIVQFFAAYKRELRMQVRSASGRHPVPPGGTAPGEPFVLHLPGTAGLPAELADTVALHPNAVQQPWFTAMGEVLQNAVGPVDCVDRSGHSNPMTVVTLNYQLEPLADHILDITSTKPGGGDPKLLRRISFTASRFRNLDDFAAYLVPAPVEAAVADPAPFAALPDRPTGAQLDDALTAAGLGAEPVPAWPRVRVLWSADAQPIAVLVDSSEPLWRSRPMPAAVPPSTDGFDPKHTYQALVERDWLVVAPAPADAAATLPQAQITRIIRGPGGTRAVAVLAAGSRRRTVGIDLVMPDPHGDAAKERRAPMVRADLLAAPWEGED